MRIIRIYILKELAGPFIFAFVITTFAFMAGNMIKLADLVVNKGVDFFSVCKLFLYMLPWLFTFTVPISVLTATLLTFGRLSSDNEITAMRASGISLYKLVYPLVLLGLVISLVSYELNDWILPRLRYETRKLVTQIGAKNPAAYLEAGTFIKAFKGYIVFIYGIDKNKLTNIRIYQPQEGRPTRTIIAQKGEMNYIESKDAIRLKLINGTVDEPNPSDPNNFYKLNFKTYIMTLGLREGRDLKVDKKKSDMSIDELKEKIKTLKSEGVDPSPLHMEIHKKISYSFSSLIFILIGIPLALMARRGEKSIGFVLSVFVIVIFYLIQLGGEALAIKGILTPALGMWLPNIVFGIIGPVMIFLMAEQ
ncbi:MAG: LptF/LptG family permease [Candidatus Omnitrophica bacterium]|nr:LptF/LptG family permease [Candidatus Omnitrophota bacterium]